MKYLLAVLLTIVTNSNLSALDLTFDQLNVGLVAGSERVESNNFPVIYKKQQYGIEFYAKATIGKIKTNYVCTVGKGKESTKINGFGDTLKGDYFDCQVYVGFFEWKRQAD